MCSFSKCSVIPSVSPVIMCCLYFGLFALPLQSSEAFELAGTWKGYRSGETMTFDFKSNGEVTLHREGQEEPVIGGSAHPARYTVDTSSRPLQFDIIIGSAADNSDKTAAVVTSERIVGIIRVDNIHEIVLNYSDASVDPERPVDFKTGSNLLKLARTKRATPVKKVEKSRDIVGKWNCYMKWDSKVETVDFVITFNADGTQLTEYVLNGDDEYAIPGTWSRVDDRIEWTFDDHEVFYSGSFDDESMRGTIENDGETGTFSGQRDE